MPFAELTGGRGRFDFRADLTSSEIESIVRNPAVRILQCSSPVPDEVWKRINAELLSHRPDIEIRVFGFYGGTTCDLSFVRTLRNVRKFSADCLMHAEGIEHLAALVNLEELSVGIYDLETFEFLALLPPSVTSLSLSATRSKKPRIEHLGRFPNLKRLYLEGQQSGIEVLAALSRLEDLTLRSISTPGLEYLRNLSKLWSLDIKLGGIGDFSAISEMWGIKYLELWQVRGLADLSFISSMTGLQYLFLESLRNVEMLPDLSRLTKLRRIWIENLKGLRDVSALGTAPSLETLIHTSAQNMQPEQYEEVLRNPSLREVFVKFGSATRNEKFSELARRAGKHESAGREFVFQ